MKLLRDYPLMRALQRLLVGRGSEVRRPRAITVPAPLESNPLELRAESNVIELQLRTIAPEGGNPVPFRVVRSSLPAHRTWATNR